MDSDALAVQLPSMPSSEVAQLARSLPKGSDLDAVNNELADRQLLAQISRQSARSLGYGTPQADLSRRRGVSDIQFSK